MRLEGDAHFAGRGKTGITITALDPSAGGTTPSRGISSDRTWYVRHTGEKIKETVEK
jgi:hypothetical protein